jgi:hypothetical protein
MKLGSALAIMALLSAVPAMPVAAKDKLPRCNGKAKRPANLYGTVLPSIPSRGGIAVSRATSIRTGQETPTILPTNLFPVPSAGTAPAAQDGNDSKVPAISANLTGAGKPVSAPISYASC